MVVATDTMAEDVAGGIILVCADPGVTGNIDRPGASPSSYTLTSSYKDTIVKLKLSLTFYPAAVL